MSILYANFSDTSVNYGNHIIEYATQKFLTEYFSSNNLKKEFTHYDSFSTSIPEGNFDSLFIPGCTMLTPGQNASLSHISKLNYPSFCLAGSLWYENKEKKILIKTRVVNLSKSKAVDISIVQNLKGIVGCRDSFTYTTCQNNNIKSLYTGCPTLFLENDIQDKSEDHVLFSFGRNNLYKQIYYASQIAKSHKIIGIVHEKGDFEKVLAAGWKFPLIDYRGDIELYLSYFKTAEYVISGRLHGILPSLAYGKKCMYFGTSDTRTSILNDLGIQVNEYSEIPMFESKSQTILNKNILNYFKNNLTKVADSIFL